MNYELITFVGTMFITILFTFKILGFLVDNHINFSVISEYPITEITHLFYAYPSVIYQIYFWTLYFNLI